MNVKEYLEQLNQHLSYLYSFARQMNELDFAASLSGEFRGSQGAGWATTITANEVYEELLEIFKKKEHSKAELRVILMLYCQIAEAGGFYEALKNIMGVITLKPYLLWPFKDLVRVKQVPRRVIGPNANATFRDLATTAKNIGLSHLSSLLELAFRDDIRNGIYHADYVIWNDGLRLRKRNGGFAEKLSFTDVNEALGRGVGFFQIFKEHNEESIKSFNPEKRIVGTFSESPPMLWTVAYNPDNGVFQISTSSPGGEIAPEYQRQVAINSRLGGKVLSVYVSDVNSFSQQIDEHIFAAGFEPNNVVMSPDQFVSLLADVNKLGLWDERQPNIEQSNVLLASPWGFRWVNSSMDFDNILGKPIINITF